MQKTIESIQKQTFTNFEVWIIDGNSSDETQHYLQNIKPPFQFLTEKDSGIYEAMNKGISLAKGEWLFFLGSGDCLHSGTILEEVSKNFNSTIQLFYGNICYENSFFHSKFSSILWLKNALHHQSVFYHKSLFENQKYDTDFKILGDYDLNLKLFRSKIISKKEEITIAFCNEHGVSKKINWDLYKEELKLKTQQTSIILFPVFFLLVFLKFVYKNIFYKI